MATTSPIPMARDDTGPVADDPAAPTLVLLHGFPLSRAMWRRQPRDLATRCRVIAPDLRGYGDTPLGGWPGAETPSLDRYADDVVALAEELRGAGPLVVCGFSMGGYILLNLLRRHPDSVDAIILMDTRAAADSDDARATRIKMAEGVADWGSSRVAELMRPKLFGPSANPADVEEIVRQIAATDPASIAASQRAMADRPDSWPHLGSIRQPTLVVVGEEDAISPPAEMRGIAAAIPHARFELIPGAGHMAPIEASVAVNDVLGSFLASLPRAR